MNIPGLCRLMAACAAMFLAGNAWSETTNMVLTDTVKTHAVQADNVGTSVCVMADQPAAVPLPESPPGTNDTGMLRLNFRGAPIDLILNYLSEAAGFIIDLRTPVKGTVDVWSHQPVTRDEAVDILNSVLSKNGYAAIRNGRTLVILSRTDALSADIPVKVGSEPDLVPKNEELVTQIIPVKFVESAQLVKDLAPMVSARATIIANEAGNSVVITDTQSNIHHIMEIIKAVDSSAEEVTEMRVFQLKHHDPVEVANLITGLFADQAGSSGSQTPTRLSGQDARGGRSGRGGGFDPASYMAQLAARGNPGAAGGSSDRIRKRDRVVAVADQRTTSVVVVASKDLITQIAGIIEQLDHETTTVSHAKVFHLENADPQQVQRVLQDMFQGSGARNSSSQSSPLLNRIQQNSSGTSGSSSGTRGSSRTGSGTTSRY